MPQCWCKIINLTIIILHLRFRDDKLNVTEWRSVLFDFLILILMIFQEFLPVMLTHTPAGTSVFTVTHYLQEIQSGQFHYLWIASYFISVKAIEVKTETYKNKCRYSLYLARFFPCNLFFPLAYIYLESMYCFPCYGCFIYHWIMYLFEDIEV